MTTIARIIRPAYVLLAVFATMITLGLIWGGFGRVLSNGIMVCLDCIGLI